MSHPRLLAKIFKAKKATNDNMAKDKAGEKVEAFEARYARERIIASDNKLAKDLYEQSRFGEPQEDKIQYALVEALYLVEKGKIIIKDEKGKAVSNDEFIRLARKVEPNFWIRYCAYKDMRNRGYIVKTALKFGADFRVYDRGIKPGEDHAKWVLFPVHEGEMLSWYSFSAMNRVAHSTRKRLLVAVVDDENDVTYYTIVWTRP